MRREASPTGDRNLASLHVEAGRYAEAEAAYRKLIEDKPDDGAIRTSLAATLGFLGRYDEALEQLAEAERLSPLNPEIYHNRGVVFERQGKPDEAVAQYREAVRYAPDFKPSRDALKRLTGSADAQGPGTAAERLAAAMCERAADAARRGDYPKALAALDEATRVAPAYSRVYQYRANVAFLMGERAAGIAALEKALALEPDNALYRHNLEALREQNTPGPADTPSE